jgi:gentisate 1,2-dioxygenase
LVGGTGYSIVGDNGPAFLFSFSDAPLMKALSLYRDEARL